MKNTKKILASMLIILSMILLIILPAFAQAPDVKDSWASKQIDEFIAKGFISGYVNGTFKPDNSITRAEFITIINKAFGFTQKSVINFSDVPSGSWYGDDLEKAVAAGYISGFSDGTFKPDSPVSRVEAAKIISTLLKCDTSCDTCAVDGFKDAASIPEWGKGFLNAVVAEKFFKGYSDGTIRPANPLTRAEAVAVLYNAIAVKGTDNSTLTAQTEETLAGTIEDAHCFAMGEPEKDTRECLQMPMCEASGYGVAVKEQDGSYKFYKFDGKGQTQAKDILKKTKKDSDITITVKGLWNGSILSVSEISEN